MNPSRIAELTVSEFKHLARGAVTDFSPTCSATLMKGSLCVTNLPKS